MTSPAADATSAHPAPDRSEGDPSAAARPEAEASTTAPPASPAAAQPLLSLLGVLLVVLTVLVVASDWGAPSPVASLVPVVEVAVVAVLSILVVPARRAFVLVALAITGLQIALHEDWLAQTLHGLSVAAFIGAFFSALTTLRHAAQTSPSIAACGRFLASQPPGRRYAALSVGGQMFSLLLNYGAIALLGSLAVASAREEPDPEIRAIRMKRMLLAVQRALVGTLPWSPLSFAVAISTALIPGASWGALLAPAFISGVILVGIGYALDTIFKPRPRRRPQRTETTGGWGVLRPLVLLLVILLTLVAVLQTATGVRTVGVVALVVPLVSAAWVFMQGAPGRRFSHLRSRAAGYVTRDLPTYRGEITLLSMAGYIGTVGATLMAEWLQASGVSFAALPTAVILVGLIWVFTLAGQVAMNPILTASLVLPLIPSADALGISSTAIQVAVTAGWALAGANSPFTATTLLTGSFAGKSAWHVGLRWNGLFTVLCGVALSAWALIYAFIVS
ncbi:hypothetical protein ATO13_08991 [Stappia sp. 22II-S9-Z10]|nr:hypothetical protein ATO13_08991 [Stappia sp. 22II-S9-Z10]